MGINTEKIIDYWQKSSKRDWKVAQNLFKLGHYNYCLFFCHLTIERLIKALVVLKTNEQASYIHDLYALMLKTGIEISPERKKLLEVITSFNMRARYDNVKFEFYKRATRDYAKRYLKISHDLILWLKKELTKR